MIRLTRFEKICVQLIQVIGITSVFLAVPAFAFQRAMNPCWPATFGNFLFHKCAHQITSEDANFSELGCHSIFLLAASLILATWLLLDMVSGFLFQFFELSFLQSYCFIYYLRHFKVLVVQSILQPNHKCVGNSKPAPIFKSLSVYRELQILTHRYNSIQQDVIIITMIWIVMVAFIGCFLVLISFGFSIHIPLLLSFLCILLDAFLAIIVIFGNFGKWHTKSSMVIQFLKRKMNIKGNAREGRWVSKYLSSMPILKVRIGSVNFVDRFTPLIMVHFCFAQIVNSLLLVK